MQNKISIIIPVYNVENYIEETLLAVVNQTYKNLEIIIVNDGSTDNSMQIVDKFANDDNRFVIVNKENGGVSDARNTGLKAVTGDYIGFVDPDDLPVLTMFEKMLESVLENDAQIAICEYVFFYPDGKTKVAGATKKMTSFPYYDNKTALEMVYTGPYRSVWNKLYKAELFKDIEFPKGLIYEGTAIQYKVILKATKVAVVNEPLYFYRAIREGSLINVKNDKQDKDWFEVYTKLYNDIHGVNDVVSTYCYHAIVRRYTKLTRRQRKKYKYVKRFLLSNMKKYYFTRRRMHMSLYIRFSIRYNSSLMKGIRKSNKFFIKILRKIVYRAKGISKNIFFGALTKITRKDKNQVIFLSRPDYSDNSRALYNEMIKHNLHEKYKIIWIVIDYDKYKNKIPHAKVMRKGSIKSYFSFIKAKYVFRTHRFDPYNKVNSKRQVNFLLWHGNSLKVMNEKAKVKYANPDYVLVSADIFKPKWTSKKVTEEKVIATGLPRNDELFAKINLKETLKYKKDFNKIFLWMPTFRTSIIGIEDGLSNEYGVPLITEDNLIRLNNKLKEINSVLLIKMHSFALYEKQITRLSNIWPINDDVFNKDITLYNLIGNVDALLSDFSSVYVDFLVKDKPIGFVYDDFDEYSNTRGFMVNNPKDYMPGAHINSLEELELFLMNVANNIDEHKELRKKIIPVLNKYTDNKNAYRVLKMLGLID